MKTKLLVLLLPLFLLCQFASAASLMLSWTDNSNVETGYIVERALNAGPFEVVAVLGADVETYADTTLTANTTYSYRVAGFNDSGQSAYSNIATATTRGGVPIAPGDATAAPPPAYDPPEPTVTLRNGESLRVVAVGSINP